MPDEHWSAQKEKAAGYWHFKLLLILMKIFPPAFLKAIAFMVGFFYFVFSKKARTVSHAFLTRAAAATDDESLRKKCLSPFGPLRHIIAFSITFIEKIQSWKGSFPFEGIVFHDDDVQDLIKNLDAGKGAVLISSHLGNSELLRGLAYFSRTGVSRNVPMTPVMDFSVTAYFSRMMRELNPGHEFQAVSANDMGPETAIALSERIGRGELLVLAGDRTPAANTGVLVKIPFLGEEADFSLGPFHLASLMDAPVYYIFALRPADLTLKNSYDMYVIKNPWSFSTDESTRAERKERVRLSAAFFASRLEGYCRKKPFQWYNFYDFWAQKDGN